MKNDEPNQNLRRSSHKLINNNERVEEFVEGILEMIEESEDWESREDIEDVQRLAEMILTDGITYGMAQTSPENTAPLKASTSHSGLHQHRPHTRHVIRRRGNA